MIQCHIPEDLYFQYYISLIEVHFIYLMFIGPCIIVIVEEWKTNLISLAILFHFLCAEHVSDINISIIRSLRLCRLLQPAKRTPPKTSRTKSSNTQRTENKTTDVVIHQHIRKLLKMDILMSEKCWSRNKWNKIASDIKFVFHSSTISMMHGPINIILRKY